MAMSTTEILLVLGLAAAVLITQLGEHALTWRRMLLPLGVAVLVGRQYLQSIPTVGGNLDFAVIGAAFGAACGVLAASLVSLQRNPVTGWINTKAGMAYAAVWVAILGGRLGFAYLATHNWRDMVGQFSMDHAITASGWTAAFVLMTLAMVLARTLVVGGRALLLSGEVRGQIASLIAA
jgi:hypothetical protein